MSIWNAATSATILQLRLASSGRSTGGSAAAVRRITTASITRRANDATVDRWFVASKHLLTDAMAQVRKIFLSDGRVGETINWQALPSCTDERDGRPDSRADE
jgi:hypothetical protein